MANGLLQTVHRVGREQAPVQTIQSWASGGTQVKTGQKEIGAMTIGTEVADLTDATIVRNTMTGVQNIVVVGGEMTGMTEADTEETVGQGQGPPEGGPDPGRGIMGDGNGLKKG